MKLCDLNDILTPEDLLELLPVGRNTLYKLLKSGELKSIRCGGKYIITKQEVQRYLGLSTSQTA